MDRTDRVLPTRSDFAMWTEEVAASIFLPQELITGISPQAKPPGSAGVTVESLTFKAVVHRSNSRLVSDHAHEREFHGGRL